MRILHVHKYYSKKRGGGSVSAFFETKKILESHGHEIMVFAMNDPDNEPSAESAYFAEHFDIRQANGFLQKLALVPRVIYNREAMKKLDDLLKHKRPDVAHVHNIYHYLTPGIFTVLRKHRIPIVFKLSDYHAICPNYSLFAHGKIDDSCRGGKYYKLFCNRSINNSWAESFVGMIEGYVNRWCKFYDKVDLFLAPSDFMRDLCVSYGFPREKIRILRNVLNFDDYAIGEDIKKEKYFLYMGRLSVEKGIKDAIDAIGVLKEKDVCGSWKLIISGKGPHEDFLRQYVSEKELDHVVEFAGFCAKGGAMWKQLMRAASVAILPSVWYDNSPIAISESMAFYTPVIVSSQGGTKEMIVDGESGFVFSAGDCHDLAKKMQQFIDNEGLIGTMGQEAAKRVHVINNEDEYYKLLMNAYHDTIDVYKGEG